MIAVGIDINSVKIAAGILGEDGEVDWHTAVIPGEARGARRLVAARDTALQVAALLTDVAVIVVEIPWASRGSSFALLSIAGVVMEALQTAHPGATILDRSTGSWKLHSLGKGNAAKAECLEHARGLGYPGADQDVADALCMSQAAWAAWWTMEGRTA